MLKSSLLRIVLVILAAFGLSLAGLSPASAHDRLTSTNPADGETVAPPENVTLTYSNDILPTGARVEVEAPDESVATSGKPQIKGKRVIQQVDASAAGKYTVTWRVTSSDGHPISGKFSFTVREGAAESPATTSKREGEPTSSEGLGATQGGAKATSGTSSEATLAPTTRVGTDDTRNHPGLIIGLAAAALIAIGAVAFYARGRLRDDD